MTMKNEFYMVLPSNSSMHYYPDNCASRYTTLLPKSFELIGEWVMAITEIQFPCNFLHTRGGEKEDYFYLDVLDATSHEGYTFKTQSFVLELPPAIYRRIGDLVDTLNSDSAIKSQISFVYDAVTGYVTVERACMQTEDSSCALLSHRIILPEKVWKMLGFKSDDIVFPQGKFEIRADRPASLRLGLPDTFFIYCDLCTPYVTGDVQSPLLRAIPFNSTTYNYGAVHCTTFSSPNYIPVIKSAFRTIEIDIRDNRGELIPFEYGPLNVTLHFKRAD